MDFDGAPDFSNPNYGKTFTMEDSGNFFGDLFGPKGLQDLAASAGFGMAGLGGLGIIGAAGAGAGAAGLGAAEGGSTALGFGAAAEEGAGLGSWFSGLGEGGMAAGGAGESISGLSALTAEGGAAGAGSAGGLADLGGAGMTAGAEGGIAEGAAGGAGFWDKLVSGASSSLAKNPLGIGAAALGLGKSIMGNKDSPEMDALRGQAGALGGQAAALNAQGQQLASYLQNGTLPPGLQASVKAAADAYKARIIQNHAKNGMSTDPRQNSALSAELAQADLNAITMTASLGQQLMSSGQEFLKMGMNAQGLSEKIYESLIRLDREQSANTGKAIANMAAALSGGGGMRMAA